MAEELSAELELSIKDALSAVDDLRDEIEKAVKDSAEEFEKEFDKAISGVPDVEIVADVDKVEPAITDAIESVDTAVPIEADIADVEPAITDAIESVDGTVPIEADAGDVGPTIAAEIEAVEGTIPITADTDAVAPAIDAAVGDLVATLTVEADTDVAAAEMAALGEDVLVTMAVEADTAPALAEINEIAEGSVTDRTIELAVALDTSAAQDSTAALGGVSDEAEESISGAATATTLFGTASSLSTGSIDAATNAVGGFLSKMGPVGGAVAGSVVALGAFTNQAVSSLGATERLTQTMGRFAANIETIDVGSLNTSLKQLALDTGSSGSAMRNAASDSFQMVRSFGVGKEEASQYSAQVLALAARAVALNPALGETGEVAGRLSNAFRSGRDKALVPYALGITSVEINSRAASIALADGGREVTQADKAMAGAALATEKLGGGLKKNIEEGAKNPILAVRSLTKEFSSATTEIGKPLVSPVLDLLKAALPSVKAVGAAVGDLAESALPVLITALDLLAPLLKLAATVLEEIPAPVLLAGVAFLLMAKHTETAADGTKKVSYGLSNAADAAGSTAGKIALVAGAAVMAVSAFKQITDGSGNATEGIMNMAIAGASLGSAFSPGLGTAIGAAAGALAGIGVAVFGGADAVEKYRAEFEKLGAELKNLDATAATMKFVEKLGMEDFVKLAAGGTTAVKGIRDELRSLASASPAAAAKVLEGLRDMRTEAGKPLFTGKEFDALEAAAEKGTRAHARHAKAAGETAAANELVEVGVTNVAAALDGETAAFDSAGNAIDFTKEKTDAAVQAAKAHKQAIFEVQDATQQNILVTQQQAAEDALAVEASRQRALTTRSVADGQRALATEFQTSVGAFDAAEAAAVRYHFGIGTAAELTEALGRAVGEMNTVLDEFFGRFLTADEATNSFKLALMDLGSQLFANGFQFDENSKAGLENQNVLDGLGQKAIGASTKILESTRDLGQAKQPLIDFRDTVISLRDKMAAAGQDTTFLDNIITNVDRAINEVTIRAESMGTAGATLSGAGATGVASTAPQWATAGAGLGQGGATSALGTLGSWVYSGDALGRAGKDAARNTEFSWLTTGNALGTTGATGVGSTQGFWGRVGDRVAGEAATGVGNKSGEMRGTGKKVGDEGASGYGQGMGQMSAGATRAVNDSMTAIALAGISVSSFAVGVGNAIGASFAAGIAGGISANTGMIESAARTAVGRAKAAAEAAAGIESPSKLFRDEVGIPISQGMAVGIQRGSRASDQAASGAVGSALDASRGTMRGGGGAPIVFNINVHGVSDPAVARQVGQEIGEGATDALTRRGVVVTARLG